jgi:hypothetical protein
MIKVNFSKKRFALIKNKDENKKFIFFEQLFTNRLSNLG